MATSNGTGATAPVALEITREERDVLWRRIESRMTGVDELYPALRDGGVVETRYWRRRLLAFVPVLESIGWHREDDRDSYVLRVDRDPLVSWLRNEYIEACDMMRREQEDLQRARAGDDGCLYVGCTLAATVEVAEENIGECLEDARVCAALLRRLGARVEIEGY